jgi:hypothetical protein
MSEKPRKPRKDMKVETFEKKTGVKLRNSDGRDTRGDKLLGTHRREEGK